MNKIIFDKIKKNKAIDILNKLKIHFITLSIISLLIVLPSWSFEDCIVTANGKMTDIKIQHNDIIDVFPLITIENDKNTLIVHPLRAGKTKFSILKNNAEKFIFNVDVRNEETIVEEKDGFEIFTVDCPPYEEYFELDEPPAEFDIDEPPIFKERKTSD